METFIMGIGKHPEKSAGFVNYTQKLLLMFLFLPVFIATAAPSDSILNAIQLTADPIARMELYIKLGDSFEYSSPETAILYYRKAYDISSDLRNITSNKNLLPKAEILRAKSLRYIGIVYSDQGNYKEALEYYFEAKKVLEDVRGKYTSVAQNEVDLKHAKLLNNIGIVFSHQSLFELAKEYYINALTVYEIIGDKKSIAVVYNSLGIIEARQANLAGALEYFRKALDIYTEIQNPEGIAQTYNNIGNVHTNHGSLDEALRLYKMAYEIFEEMKYLHRMASTLNNIGRVYHRHGDYENAIVSLQEGIRLRKEVNDQKGLCESYIYLADMYIELEDYDKAKESLFKVLEITNQSADTYSLSLAHINLGRIDAGLKLYQRAIEKTKVGLDIALHFNLKFVTSMAYQNLSDYFHAIGKYKDAYEFSRMHYELSQEIFDEQRMRHINELEIGYQAREKQQKIELLEQEKELSSLKFRQSQTYILILALFFLLFIIIGVFILTLLKQRSRINLLDSERLATTKIKKAFNDLNAVLRGHAHAYVLLDDKLDVLALNPMAEHWFHLVTNINLNPGDSLYSLTHPVINDLIYEQMFFSLRGENKNREIEFLNIQAQKKNFYKIYSNPIYDETGLIIQSVSLMIEDITQRRETEARIIADLREKETLIKEIHHRVKNNMQVIISLIRLQSNEIVGASMKESFLELEQRVAAMSYVHEDLYKSENLSDINFEDYLKKISSNLCSIYNRAVTINNTIDLKNTFVNIDIAVPCGLIVNELLSNSLKHAFNTVGKANNKIDIRFTEGSQNYELVVSDNGKGLKKDFCLEKITSMGLHLVKVIVEEQLRGNWTIGNGKGVTIAVSFPKATSIV